MVAQFIQSRHGSGVNQFSQRYEFPAYQSEGIFLLGGSARIEDEVVFSRQAQRMCKTKYAVLTTPLGVDMSDCTWGCVQLVGIALFGDILGSVWQVGVIGISTLRMFDGPNFAQVAKTMGARYNECGLMAAGDERGAINHHAIQSSRG